MEKRIITFLITICITTAFLTGCIEDSNESTNNVVILGKGNYLSIQEAIDSAEEGDNINVYKGTYEETIIITKQINLIGEGNNKTIIKALVPINESTKNSTDAMKIGFNLIEIKAPYCNISGFKLIGLNTSTNVKGIKISTKGTNISNNVFLNLSDGIALERGSKENIIHKNIMINNKNGIYLYYSPKNKIIQNSFSLNTHYGIYIQSSSDSNNITRNHFYENDIGMRVKGSQHNNIFRNKIINNLKKGIYVCCGASNNNFYNNTLINNTINGNDPYSNTWDHNGYGNYWDDYNVKYPDVDEDNNGIWDTPYILGRKSQDNYPLVNPVEI